MQRLRISQVSGLFVVWIALLLGCAPENERYLDWAIPRVVTPVGQIAVVRTRWVNGKLLQTTFLDRQSRVLEDFRYGLTSEKMLNRYAGDHNTVSIHYYHSDSSPGGHLNLDTVRRTFDPSGRVIADEQTFAWMTPSKPPVADGFVHRFFMYKANGDTVVTAKMSTDTSGRAAMSSDIEWWERDGNGRIIRHLRLQIWKRGFRNIRPDTAQYYIQRFAYDTAGRRQLAWCDPLHLDDFYRSIPDTIRYIYDKQNRLVRELHQFTTDKRNKRLIDTANLDTYAHRSIRGFLKNAKTDTVDYRYESFIPAKHLPLHVSLDVGH